MSKVVSKLGFSCNHYWSQGEIVRSDRMEVNVGGADAMADLVEGTTELAVEEEGRGDSSKFQLPLYFLQMYIFQNENLYDARKDWP